MSTGILNGVRVIDFGRYIAGPYAGWLLASLGAEVIRIEKMGGSEDRYMSALYHDKNGEEGQGAMFFQNNCHKKTIGLNPKLAASQEIQKKLIESADVVLANMPEAGLKKMGIDYDSLKAIKPDIIFTWVTALGSEGPWAEKAGFDGIAQAMSGSMFMTGTPDNPVKAAAPYVDNSTAMTAAMGTLAALWHREKTGEGQVVEASLLASAVAIYGPALCEQSATNLNREPTGNRVQTSGPSDVCACSDGHIIVHVVGNGLFKRIATAIGHEEWLEDDRFNTDNKRGDERDILCNALAQWCKQRTVDEALEILAKVSVPAGPVLNLQEALDHPQIQGMALMEQVDHPKLNKPAQVSKPPFRFSKTPALNPIKPADIGEHTEAILKDIGYETEEIKELLANGAAE